MIGTGYTYKIEDGTCKTPKDFLKLCLKAFGCCIELRDESLNSFDVEKYINDLKNRPISDFLIQGLERAEKELEELLKKSYKDWKKELDSKIKETEESLEKHKKIHDEESKLISYFVTEIEKWNCSLKYLEIKKFALQQLSVTNADNYEWDERLLKEYHNTTVKAFRNSAIESAIKSVDYYKESIEFEKQKRQETVEFLEGFLKEIEDLD